MLLCYYVKIKLFFMLYITVHLYIYLSIVPCICPEPSRIVPDFTIAVQRAVHDISVQRAVHDISVQSSS